MITTNVAIAALGAGMAVGAAGLASGTGSGITGAAGAGAVAENPNFFGLLIAILIMINSGLIGA